MVTHGTFLCHEDVPNTFQICSKYVPIVGVVCSKCVRPTDDPSNRESVRPTVRPVLLRRKTNIVLTATTSTLFIATTKETTKEVARPEAAPPL